MSEYFYKCFNCQKTYDKEKIEDSFKYLCPDCGKAEKNAPLKGVLSIEYNYERIKSELEQSKFLKYHPGQFWKYPQLWPLEYDSGGFKNISNHTLQNLSLLSNPIVKVQNKNLLFFDDTRNPTYSYKDRASILVALKAIQFGINEISAASTGNAGSSLAGICARLGLKSHIFVPKSIPEAKRIQIQAYGASLHIVDGDYDLAFDLCLEVSEEKGWYNRNTAYNPLTIEGKKSAAFDMFISLGGKLPETIIIPVGDGVILGGLFKGFWELKQLGWIENLPKLIAVVAEGSDALKRYIETNEFEYKPANTIADSISAGAPRNLYMAVNAIKESNGVVKVLSDAEILNAQKELSTKYGFLVEPAAAASYAGYKKIKNSYSNLKGKNIMLMLTGSGLKDTASLTKWNRKQESKSFNKWKESFKLN